MSQNKTEVLSSMIAEKVWGHRFRSGQRGAEYTLEFLNVMAGTEYKLTAPSYKRKKMIEFRKFVFEGEKEGREVKGQKNYVLFDAAKKNRIAQELKIDNEELTDIQDFLNNLKVELRQQDGSKVNRSWYAQFLFPLHESMLFFEVRTKGNSVGYERNFFSRGGELYYLALSHGIGDNQQLKAEIEIKIKRMLNSNQNIGAIVNRISSVLTKDGTDADNSSSFISVDSYPLNKEASKENESYPKLAVTESKVFTIMANELNSFLNAKLDIHDSFRYLTSLICIQLFRYMISRCEDISKESGLILMDCTDGQNAHIRRIAQKSYKTHQRIVMKAFDSFSEEEIKQLLPEEEALTRINNWKESAKKSTEKAVIKKYESFFRDTDYNRLGEKNKLALINALENPDEKAAYHMLLLQMKDIALQKQVKEDFSILGVLGRDGGFISQGKGTQPRYIMTDTLLNALVLALLEGERKMSFDKFKGKLFKHFNIIIGVEEAQKSEICQNERINLGCFKDNEQRFRHKLKKNGLLEEFSDATAFIVNPAYTNGGV